MSETGPDPTARGPTKDQAIFNCDQHAEGLG